mmetsp:Transcript_79735/g.165660  ORF Transcript_79735/g.165660 Transcript_79735/m.165660 type:complete len:234 (-) Transcript_79735:124-825(-)
MSFQACSSLMSYLAIVVAEKVFNISTSFGPSTRSSAIFLAMLSWAIFWKNHRTSSTSHNSTSSSPIPLPTSQSETFEGSSDASFCTTEVSLFDRFLLCRSLQILSLIISHSCSEHTAFASFPISRCSRDSNWGPSKFAILARRSGCAQSVASVWKYLWTSSLVHPGNPPASLVAYQVSRREVCRLATDCPSGAISTSDGVSRPESANCQREREKKIVWACGMNRLGPNIFSTC